VPWPSPREGLVLGGIGAHVDPAVRLAWQLRPMQDIQIVPMLPAQAGEEFAHSPARIYAGKERYIVSMFVDMRGSTRMAADQLPFDTVFIVNRFLGAVSQAVTQAGGKVNQYLGDGLLALFGIDTDRRVAARQALAAAAMIAANIKQLNGELAEAARSPIRFGIGINGGEVILGDIGYGETIVFTALGDAVNVAARLQDLTKELECEAVVSQEVYALAGLPDDGLPAQETVVRGRSATIMVRTAADAEELATLMQADAVIAADTGRDAAHA